MDYWYSVQTEDAVTIDFDYVYDSIKKELEKEGLPNRNKDIYWKFLDNLEYYLMDLYYKDNFVASDNEYICECIDNDWTNYFKEKFIEW